MNSIRARLLIVMLLIVTLSLGILGGINYWKTSEILLREVEASMSEKVGDNSAAISAWFAERQAETTLQRFGDESRLALGIPASLLFETVGLLEFLPVLDVDSH